MIDLKQVLRSHIRDDEEGQGLVEYGMVIFLVAIVIVAILVFLGPQIGSIFSVVTKKAFT